MFMAHFSSYVVRTWSDASGSVFQHDDVIKWKKFPRYWPSVLGIHRSPVNSLHKGQWRWALMFSLICAWINGWVNIREAGNLRRHCADYDVKCCNEHKQVILPGAYYTVQRSFYMKAQCEKKSYEEKTRSLTSSPSLFISYLDCWALLVSSGIYLLLRSHLKYVWSFDVFWSGSWAVI